MIQTKTHFDLSDPLRDDLKDDQHKNVIGKIKDETNSLPISEIVALNPKCYSFNHLKKDDALKNTKKAKGVPNKCG